MHTMIASAMALLVVGLLTGFSSGLFGIGGALIGTPLLRIIGQLPPLLALATPLPVAIPSAVSGALAYWKRGLVDRVLAWRTLRVALPMTLLGSVITHWTPGSVLMVTTAVVLIYVAISMIRRQRQLPANDTPASSMRVTIAAGIAGFAAGFLAIGGGIVLVPVYIRWLRVPVHRALATSLVCVTAMALPGTLVHGMLGHIAWDAAGLVALTAIPASWLGARLALQLKGRTLELSYGILLAAFGVWFFVRSLAAQ
jgi:hypothetical protein